MKVAESGVSRQSSPFYSRIRFYEGSKYARAKLDKEYIRESTAVHICLSFVLVKGNISSCSVEFN